MNYVYRQIIFILCMPTVLHAYSPSHTIFHHFKRHVDYIHALYDKTTSASVDRDVDIIKLPRPHYTYADIFSFSHPIMKTCVNAITHYQSIEPFFTTWNYIATYPASAQLNQYLLLREYGTLMAFLYNNVTVALRYKESTPLKALSFDDVVALYTALRSLPVTELLHTLDELCESIAVVIEDTHMSDSILQWIMRYWWMPPVIVSGIILSIMRSEAPILIS